MKYLVKYYDYWSDEFPVEGQMLLTEEEYKEFYKYWSKLTKLLCEGYEFSWYFGTNEDIYYCGPTKWTEAFSFEEVPEADAEVLEGYIFNAENYIGLLPDAEFMYNELEVYAHAAELKEEEEND